ncbi:MAG: crosslink repair DNA glycosylase YcaQ family protein [Phycisphaerales bacterium]
MTTRAHATVPATAAARLLLLGAGLLDEPTGPVDAARVHGVVERLGFVQIDSINTLERAHHLTLHARLDGYRHRHLATLLEHPTERTLFEHWTHDASVIPLAWYPHWKHRFAHDRRRIAQRAWWRARAGPDAERMLRRVKARIRANGPMMARDFESPRDADDCTARSGDDHNARSAQSDGWWNWKPEKAALELIWRSGELAIARREGFQKVYDLAERVHGEHHAHARPGRTAHIDWACRTAFERLAIATPREAAHFWNAITLEEARRWCASAMRRGTLVPVQVEGDDGTARAAAALHDWRDRMDRATAAPDRLRLLSPFDPVVRDRARAGRLFGFDYRFEAFVPAAKRVFGYYTLPMLHGERFVGRLAARHDRERRTLVVERVGWEAMARTRRRALDDQLDAALDRLATLVDARRVERPGARA